MVTNRQKVFTGFIRDISEKKRAEQAIRASERNLSLIINTMPVPAWFALPRRWRILQPTLAGLHRFVIRPGSGMGMD